MTLFTEEAPTIDQVHNEIELLHELNNGPNIIELFDVYETQTYVFLGRLSNFSIFWSKDQILKPKKSFWTYEMWAFRSFERCR